ncbi:MAG: DUF6364 family protein [Bacteroidota bacterium]
MTTKLTLTMEDGVINSAKKYARKNGRSLSDIVENYLKSIAVPEENTAALSPKVTRLMGIITLPDDFDHKKEMGQALMKKYR